MDVTFVDSQHGWAVGDDGTVVHTSDGGDSWERQDSGTDVKLVRVSFVNPEEGWIVGQFGTILHTSDGGQTWERQKAGSIFDRHLVAVSFVDERTGWAITERGGVILGTEDGGETWTRQFFSGAGIRSDMVFVDSRRGWVVFTQGSLLHTLEGGDKWVYQPGINEVRIGTTGAFFLDENNGWVTGWRGKRPGLQSGLQFLRFLSDGMVARTTDGGKTWTRHDVGTGHTVWDVAFVNAQEGWAVGSFGTILSSDDGGITWTLWPSGTEATLRGVAFADGDNGWAVGDGGTILKFTRR